MKQKETKVQRRPLNVLQEAWRTINDDYLKKLQASFAKRVQTAEK